MPVIAHPARRIELPHHQDCVFAIVEQSGDSEIHVFDTPTCIQAGDLRIMISTAGFGPGSMSKSLPDDLMASQSAWDAYQNRLRTLAKAAITDFDKLMTLTYSGRVHRSVTYHRPGIPRFWGGRSHPLRDTTKNLSELLF